MLSLISRLALQGQSADDYRVMVLKQRAISGSTNAIVFGCRLINVYGSCASC